MAFFTYHIRSSCLASSGPGVIFPSNPVISPWLLTQFFAVLIFVLNLNPILCLCFVFYWGNELYILLSIFLSDCVQTGTSRAGWFL
ncbi:hypothetical protein RSAG8_08239, partial [Rhizoctonia solani AG-8 WAC10335]